MGDVKVDGKLLLTYNMPWRPIAVATRSKELNVFARSNTEILGSNLTKGMDVSLCAYSAFVLSCVCSVLATG
jgi:hypothetical protein